MEGHKCGVGQILILAEYQFRRIRYNTLRVSLNTFLGYIELNSLTLDMEGTKEDNRINTTTP